MLPRIWLLPTLLALAVALALAPAAAPPAAAEDHRDGVRIVGGSAVSPTAYAAQWPWLVIVTITDLGNTYECTGSVLAPQWVLTAQHCSMTETFEHRRFAARSFRVYGGSPAAGQAGQLGTVDAVYRDSSYTPSDDVFNTDISARGDVVLLHLAAPVSLMAFPMLARSSPTGPTVATALGWGKTSGSSGDVSPTLRAVRVTVHPTDADTLYNAGPGGTCNGDSGGPLAAGSVIIGTTSYGDDACTTDNYYTDTASVTPWIMATTAAVTGSAQPTVATAPRISARDVVVRANTSRVRLTMASPPASAGSRVACNRPAHRTVLVPSRTVTTCTATSAGGSARASYVVRAQRARHAVVVRSGGRRVSHVRRGQRVAATASGFPARAVVSVRWGARRTTVRADAAGTVRLHLRAPRVIGIRALVLRGDGATTQIRVQAVRLVR